MTCIGVELIAMRFIPHLNDPGRRGRGQALTIRGPGQSGWEALTRRILIRGTIRISSIQRERRTKRSIPDLHIPIRERIGQASISASWGPGHRHYPEAN